MTSAKTMDARVATAETRMVPAAPVWFAPVALGCPELVREGEEDEPLEPLDDEPVGAAVPEPDEVADAALEAPEAVGRSEKSSADW